jgi:hypothetical protein
MRLKRDSVADVTRWYHGYLIALLKARQKSKISSLVSSEEGGKWNE